jgi:eukaryotic-like serine/threonine-protein kinase
VVGGLKQGDPRLIGPYRLIGQLGSGGMGRVFLGLSAGGRPVAVKVIRAELAADQEFRVRFNREVSAARRVSGLFTALVVDADVDGPVPWLATAYVAGPSLAQAIKARGPMSVQSVLALAAGLAEGLSAIHAAGVVHCDLKPSNVLLSQDGPRVIDFGISRAVEVVSVTGAGLVIGSPGFMSPEQAMSEEIGPPSDVFSLGAVLTFAATGEGPFGQGSSPELAYRLVYSTPSLGELPVELHPLVERCLAKDPAERPTAAEVLAEAGAARPAAGWPMGAFAQYTAPRPVAGSAAAASVARLSGRISSRRWWRPLTAAGVAAGIVAASVAVSLAPRSADRQSSAAQFAPPPRATATTRPWRSVRSDSPSASPSDSPSASPSTRPGSDIIPVAVTVTSPTAPPSRRSSPSGAKSPRVTASASATPTTASPSTAPSPSVTPSPTPPPAPRITSVSTYQQGMWVYFDVYYADPGQDAQGFGFMGVDESRWVEASHPFARPHHGIVGPDSVAYPLNLECGTAHQRKAEIEVWIYATAAARSQPVAVNLAC